MSARQLGIALGLLAGSFGSSPASGGEPPPQRPSRLYTIEQFMDTTEIRGNSFSADESKLLFSSDRSGIFNLYTVPVTGGEPAALTHSTVESMFSVSFFPKDDRIL